MGLDPCHAVFVVAHEEVAGEDGQAALLVQGVGDDGGDARSHRHGEEGRVQLGPAGKAEGDVAGPAYGVDPQLLPDQAKGLKDLPTRAGSRPFREHKGIDEHVLGRDTVVPGPVHDLPGHSQSGQGVPGDPSPVHGQADDGGSVLLHQRKDVLQPLLLPRYRVHQGLSPIDLQAPGQGLHHRGIDGEGNVGDGLHQLHRSGQEGRLIHHGDPGVHVQHVSAGRHLGQGIVPDPGEVPRRHLRGEPLSPRGVDPLPDEGDGAVRAHHNRPGGRAQRGVQGTPPSGVPVWMR